MNQPLPTVHRPAAPWRIAAQLLRGRSQLRGCFEESLRALRLPLAGRVVDLGGKSATAHYLAEFAHAPGLELVHTDLNAAPGVVAVDVQRPLPFADASVDTFLCFHLLEHVADPSLIASECRRCLRPGGRVCISVPFLFEYHADPDDYRRFTDRELVRWWTGAGFAVEHLEALGDGPVTALATRLPTLLLPPVPGLRRVLAMIAYLLAWPWDLLLRWRPMRVARPIPFAYAQGFLMVVRAPA
jgi:SAM-dependent methyltransferase